MYDDNTTLRCPHCQQEMAWITLEVRSGSDRVAQSLFEQLIPIADGLMLPFCDNCRDATEATSRESIRG
jgi:hypothetical protein